MRPLLLILPSTLMGCRTTVVEVQVYVTGDQGEPLDTADTDTVTDTGATDDTATSVPVTWTDDLLVVDRDGGLAWAHLGDGASLGQASSWSVPDVTGLDLSLADLDGDGREDLWGRDGDGKTMTVWLQDVAGGFKASPAWDEFTNIAAVRDVLIGDFDGDGSADLATWVDESNLLHVFHGTGAGVNLTQVVDSTLSGVFAGEWWVADVDADGMDDAVRVSDDRLAAWTSNGGALGELTRNATVDVVLSAPIDGLLELDGLYGAELLRREGPDLLAHLRAPGGWATDPLSLGAVGDGELLAGRLGD